MKHPLLMWWAACWAAVYAPWQAVGFFTVLNLYGWTRGLKPLALTHHDRTKHGHRRTDR